VFAARGIVVCDSVFLLVYLVLSVAVCRGWRTIFLWSGKIPARHFADLLVALRLLPFLAALGVTAGFVIPSFLLLEPRGINETLGGIPLALGIAGLVLTALGVCNVTASAVRASKIIAVWTREGKPVHRTGTVPVLRISSIFPALTASGILRPRVLISKAAELLLTTSELEAALRHEFAHIRRWDNLKKLLFRFVRFPGMSGLESAWLDETEMAADDAAVSNETQALDLAAAIIKLSRLSWKPGDDSAQLGMALVHDSAESTHARVGRLIRWSEKRHSTKSYFTWYALASGLATVASVALTYNQLLVHLHSATEWLFR
jgi:hypothetical protein